MKEDPYSFHSFMFPFAFSDKKYIDLIEQFQEWEKIESIPTKLEDRQDYYNIRQYFNHNARNVIRRANVGYKQPSYDLVKSYQFKIGRKEHPEKNAVYKIYYRKDKKEEKLLELDIQNITLDLYDTKVGVLTFDLENYKNQKIENIKRINDLGRRIFLPSVQLQEEKEDWSITADKIEIEGLDTGDKITVDFIDAMKQLKNGNKDEKIAPLNGYSEIVSFFLLNHLKGKVEFGDKQKGKKIYLTPIMDDRMFVQSMIRNKEWMDYIKNQFSKTKDNNQMYDLYAILFADGTSSSCQNEKMLEESFEKNCYTRWTNYGTLYGITQHSFVLITDIGKCSDENYEENYRTVILPFLTLYKEMARLVLVQRASIIQLSNDASDIAFSLTEKRKQTQKTIQNIQELQENYVKFQNQMLLYEVTTQQQGIELYKMLQKELFINEQKEELEAQLKNFYDIANINANDMLNDTVMGMTILSILLTMVDLYISNLPEEDITGLKVFLQQKELKCLMQSLAIMVAACSLFCILYFVYSAIRKRRRCLNIVLLLGMLLVTIIVRLLLS